MGGVADAARLLGDRRFRRWFIGRWVSVTGSTISPVALAWAIVHLGGGAGGIAVVLLGGPIVFMIFSPLGGVTADRFPRIPIMVICQITSGIAQALSAAVILTRTANVPILTVLALLAGASGAFFTPASQAVLPALVSKQHLHTANALRQITNNTVMIIGPSVAGAVIVACGPGWILAWDAATFFLSAALLAGVRIPTALPTGPRQRWSRDLAEGWSAFRSRRWLWVLALLSAITGMAWATAVNVVGPLYAMSTLGGPVAWGIVQSAIGVGYITGSVISLLTRPRHVGLVVIGGYVPDVVFLAAMATGAPLAVVAATAAGAGAAGTLQMITYQSHLQAVVPDDQLSRVLSMTGMIGTVGIPIAYGIAGPAAAAFGIHAIQWACVATVIIAVASTFSLQEVRRLRGQPAVDLVSARASQF
ncbi:MFS transporter [Actinomadura geliboluensis]|uniref:MFS transporter n=1 Tax=Actinomadura geliboluensis TaxID=882440 RepID=UPI0037174852